MGAGGAEVLVVGDLGPQKAAELAVPVEKEVEQVGHLVVAPATFLKEGCDLGLRVEVG